MLAAEIVGAVWKLGAAAPPLGGPAKTELAAAFDKVNVSAGVVVEVATLVVNKGERVPAVKFVTEPPPAPDPVKVQLVPEQEPAPAEKLKVKAPPVPLMLVTPAEADTQAAPVFVILPLVSI